MYTNLSVGKVFGDIKIFADLQPGEDGGGALDEEQTDEADHKVVGEAEHPGRDEVVSRAAGAGASPGPGSIIPHY